MPRAYSLDLGERVVGLVASGETQRNRTKAAIDMITVRVCQQSVSSEIPTVGLAD